MQVTDVNVFPVHKNRLRANVNITIDDCFMVRGLKVIEGDNGLFVAMPNKKSKNGKFRDIAHPLNSETRQMIEKIVLDHYIMTVNNGDATFTSQPSDLIY